MTSTEKREYLERIVERLSNAIAFNVSCPEMLKYQRAMLAQAEYKLSQLSE